MNRRTFIAAAAAICVAGLSVPMLGGCTVKAPTAAVGVVLDKGANSALADGSAAFVREACWPVVEGGGRLAIIVASSRPEVLCDAAVPSPGNPAKEALDGRWSKEGVFSPARQIDEASPRFEEVDLLESIKLAAQSLRGEGAQACEVRTLCIASSGLSTTGLIDMTGRGRYGDILELPDYGELVERVASDTSHGSIESDGLPDLTGVHVVWCGVGQLTAGAQAAIPPHKLAAIKDLWTAVLASSGAEFDPTKDFVAAPAAEGSEVDRSSLPVVTPVVFDETLSSSITFDENVLGFEENSDVYRDDWGYVKAVLSPYAKALSETGEKVVVLGCTADDRSGLASCRELGMRRARRVVDDLVAMGVDDRQLVACSAGCEGTSVLVGDEMVDFYQNNFNADGSFNDAIAAKNRSISIIPFADAGEVVARFGA